MLTGHVAPALPAPRPLAQQGTTRASPVALPLHPTIPVTSTNPTMLSRAQDCALAPAELRSSAVFTPVKVSTPAEDELCAWLREKACLHKVVIEKSLSKLHTSTTSPNCVLHITSEASAMCSRASPPHRLPARLTG